MNPVPASATDLPWLRSALALAQPWLGRVHPNPPVGCVLVTAAGHLLAEGWHEGPGLPHAEGMALAKAGEAARGCTAYVTLEPCNHFGRTPPCSQALIAAGVARVVFAVADPHAEAKGGGSALRESGIAVSGPAELAAVSGANEVLHGCRQLVSGFLSFAERGRPFVVAKWAMSLDGRIATRSGDSKWITGDAARQLGRRLRAELGAVAVGSGTVLADDPALTWRGDEPLGQPVRVVFDARARLPLASQLVTTATDEQPVVLVTRDTSDTSALRDAGVRVVTVDPGPDNTGVDLAAALPLLARDYQIQGLLIEGGSALLGAAFDAGIVDRVVAFIAPVIIGGDTARSPLGGSGAETMADALRLEHVTVTPVGDDVRVEGDVPT